jgi:hypothetical protein
MTLPTTITESVSDAVITKVTPSQPVFDPRASFAAWEARSQHYNALMESVLADNKIAAFDKLMGTATAIVTVSFDGCSDSGQIDDIVAVDSGGLIVALPDIQTRIRQVDLSTHAITEEEVNLTEAFEAMAYALLESSHEGWENNEGAYGEFVFDTSDRSITLKYHERFESSNYFEQSW